MSVAVGSSPCSRQSRTLTCGVALDRCQFEALTRPYASGLHFEC